MCLQSFFFFFFNDTATTEIYTLSLHDALPICQPWDDEMRERIARHRRDRAERVPGMATLDRKSTRLNSSHLVISYAVFCLKKKKLKHNMSYLVIDFTVAIPASLILIC